MYEQTLAIIKPDAVACCAVGNIIKTIEWSGLQILEIRRLVFTDALAREFYKEHDGKPFHPGLISHTTSGPCYALVLSGESAVARWRAMMGPTDPQAQRHGFALQDIRSKYGTVLPRNAAHGSDSTASAQREFGLLFPGRTQLAVQPLGIQFSELPSYASCPTTCGPLSSTKITWSPPLLPEFGAVEVAQFKKVDGAARLPERAHPHDAGWDVFAIEDGMIGKGQIRKMRLGLAMALPPGYEAQLRTRSGLGSKGVIVANSPATVDAGYRGELMVALINHTGETYQVKIGDKIAQMVFQALPAFAVAEVEELPPGDRGAAGWGSTGR